MRVVAWSQVFAVSLSIAGAASARAAQADLSPPPASPTSPPAPDAQLSPPDKPGMRWYGWQTLAADGASVGIFLLAASTHADGVGWAGVFTYLGAPPILHVTHGHGAKAMLSLSLRLGAPLLGAAVGSRLEHCSPGEWFCGLEGAAEGLLIGMGTAIAVDAAALAWEDAPARPRTGAFVSGLGLMPTLVRSGGGLSFSGAF